MPRPRNGRPVLRFVSPTNLRATSNPDVARHSSDLIRYIKVEPQCTATSFHDTRFLPRLPHTVSPPVSGHQSTSPTPMRPLCLRSSSADSAHLHFLLISFAKNPSLRFLVPQKAIFALTGKLRRTPDCGLHADCRNASRSSHSLPVLFPTERLGGGSLNASFYRVE